MICLCVLTGMFFSHLPGLVFILHFLRIAVEAMALLSSIAMFYDLSLCANRDVLFSSSRASFILHFLRIAVEAMALLSSISMFYDLSLCASRDVLFSSSRASFILHFLRIAVEAMALLSSIAMFYDLSLCASRMFFSHLPGLVLYYIS